MANRAYTKALEKYLAGTLALPTDTLKCVLVDGADYTPSTTTDEFLSSVPAFGRVATTDALTGKTVTGGVFDANDTVFAAASGDQSELIVIYKDTGNAATSPLVHLIDTVAGGSLLSVIPNGGDITVVWDNGANKIFAL